MAQVRPACQCRLPAESQARRGVKRITASIGLAALLLAQGATAADWHEHVPERGFRASCEDLATFCFADACGRDQIAAAQACQARCPSAVILSVVPAACRVPDAPPAPVLPRRG
jgi:hypothetical protein